MSEIREWVVDALLKRPFRVVGAEWDIELYYFVLDPPLPNEVWEKVKKYFIYLETPEDADEKWITIFEGEKFPLYVTRKKEIVKDILYKEADRIATEEEREEAKRILILEREAEKRREEEKRKREEEEYRKMKPRIDRIEAKLKELQGYESLNIRSGWFYELDWDVLRMRGCKCNSIKDMEEIFSEWYSWGRFVKLKIYKDPCTGLLVAYREGYKSYAQWNIYKR